MYPQAPHLSAFVIPSVTFAEALVVGTIVPEEAGCFFTGEMLVARHREGFRSVSDIESEIVRFPGDAKGLLAEDPLLRMPLIIAGWVLVAGGSAKLEETCLVDGAGHFSRRLAGPGGCV